MLSKYFQIATAMTAGVLLLGSAVPSVQAQANLPLGRSQTVANLPSGDSAPSYQTLYVNPEIGSDSADGLEAAPLRTVTRALEVAPPNTVIVLAPGRYTQGTGEVFPLQLKPGVTIQGTPGSSDRTAIIEGGGSFTSPTRSQQNATIIAADRAGLAQIAVSNPDGYGLWIESTSPTILESAFVGNRQTGIYVAGGSPRVQGSYFSGNQVAGVIVFGVSSANIHQNIFDGTGDAIRVLDGATPEIVGNRITNNDASLVLIGDARPVVHNNQIEGNRQNDVVEVAARTRDISSSTDLASELEEEEKLADEIIALTPEPARIIPNPPAAIPSPPESAAPVAVSTPLPSTTPSITPSNSNAASAGETLIEADALPAIEPRNTPRDIPQSTPPSPIQSTIQSTVSTLPPLPTQSLPTQSLPAQSLAPAAIPIPVEPAQTESPRIEPAAPTERISLLTELTPVPDEPSEQLLQSLPDETPDVQPPNDVPGQLPAGSPGAALQALNQGLEVASLDRDSDAPGSLLLNRRRRRREQTTTVEPRQPPAASQPAPIINNNRLAVPSSSIPLGSGQSATIFSPPNGGAGAPPAPPSRAQALGLYYRVFVEASDPFVQDDIRAVVPDAFRTRYQGRAVMQVGAFPTEGEAEDRRRLLEANGFSVQVEYIR
ncbi:MAG: DUF1565 domain-containing protein [Cyanobacteria bacterium J06627_28]